MYRILDAERIVATLETLRRRIAERFPDASLTKVCAELTAIARESGERARRIATPDYALRAGSVLVIVGGLALLVYAGAIIEVKREGTNVYGILQGIESGFNILLLMGAAIFFLVTFETRWKRRRALGDVHELRSIVHVIDMHQLTKDPSAITEGASPTASSPERKMSPYDLGRYLDYCSELLSLTAKVAALYAQSSKDPVVIEAASDIGQITTNLSNKIWQKIALMQQMSPMRAPSLPIAPR
jgi:hypothetical protein